MEMKQKEEEPTLGDTARLIRCLDCFQVTLALCKVNRWSASFLRVAFALLIKAKVGRWLRCGESGTHYQVFQ